MDIWDAASGGELERVKALVAQARANLNVHDVQGQTPLWRAARGGHIEVVQYLLDIGANMSYFAYSGSTALHEACTYGHAAVVSLFLQRAADVTVLAGEGRTALMWAAICGREAVVRVLLENGGSALDARDNFSLSTAMHYACLNGHAGVLRQLLEAGADPRLRDGQGRTAVDRAAPSGHRDCVRVMQEWDRAYMLQKFRYVEDAVSISLRDALQQHSS